MQYGPRFGRLQVLKLLSEVGLVIQFMRVGFSHGQPLCLKRLDWLDRPSTWISHVSFHWHDSSRALYVGFKAAIAIRIVGPSNDGYFESARVDVRDLLLQGLALSGTDPEPKGDETLNAHSHVWLNPRVR